MPERERVGLEYGLWWLVAALVLPVADLALVGGASDLGLALGVTSGWVPGLLMAVVLNVGLLRWWGRRVGASGAVIGAAVAVSFVVAVFVFAILIVAVIAPAVS